MFMNYNTIQSEGYTHIFTFFGVLLKSPIVNLRNVMYMYCTYNKYVESRDVT